MRETPFETAEECVKYYLTILSPIELAGQWRVHNVHIYKAKHGRITPLLEKRLQSLKLIPFPEKRFRRTIEFRTEREALEYDRLKALNHLTTKIVAQLVLSYLRNF